MTVIIKGKLRDLLSFVTHLKKRNRIFKKAKTRPIPVGRINDLAQSLHPHQQDMEVISITDETSDTKTFRLQMADPGLRPAFFRAGQYISCYFQVDNSTVFRPFSISSTPYQAKNEGFYDLTIKRTDDGFISRYAESNWKIGTRLVCTGPAGDFYYQQLRDHKTLVCIGGGSGITPFKAIISDLLDNYSDLKIILIHGAVSSGQFIFSQYFTDLNRENGSRFFYSPICSEPPDDWQGKTGFISAAAIKDTLNEFAPDTNLKECSFFLCGPPLMEQYLDTQFAELQIKQKQIRKEQYAVNKIENNNKIEEFSLIINMNTGRYTVNARSDETILVAMERAGLNPPSLCRSGTCGWCRSRLIAGKVKSPTENNGLRLADKKFGFIHPCSEFPASDLELYVPDMTIKKPGGIK